MPRRLPHLVNTTLVQVIRDVILDTDDCLDPYCNARVRFWSKGILASCRPSTIIAFLAIISAGKPAPAGGELPALLNTVPANKRFAVTMAGFWLDEAEVVRHVMHMQGYTFAGPVDTAKYKFPGAEHQMVEWFRTTPASEIL